MAQISLPPFIKQPGDSSSPDHQQACLAWHLLTARTDADRAEYLRKQKPQFRESLEPHLVRCKAWLLLCNRTELEIRYHLQRLPIRESQPLRAALNDLYKPWKKQRGEVNG